MIARARTRFRSWIAFIAVATLLMPAAFAGEAPSRPYRIGVLNEAWAPNHPTVEGLKAGLRDWGFIEDRDVTYDIRFTKGDAAATQEAAEALVKAGMDLIFTSNESATLAAKKATDRIPIVFTLVGDPIGAIIVPSLSRPGGNITGVSSRAIALAPKRMEILKMLVPKLRRVWFIYHVTDITGWGALDHMRQAATRLDIELITRTVRNAEEVGSALKEIKPGDGVIAPAVDTLDIPVTLLEAARGMRVPAIFSSELFVNHGAVISYGPELRAQGMQAARLVARLLRGTRPRDLPVESADRIDLSVNLQAAAQLEITVPQKVLVRANSIHR